MEQGDGSAKAMQYREEGSMISLHGIPCLGYPCFPNQREAAIAWNIGGVIHQMASQETRQEHGPSSGREDAV